MLDKFVMIGLGGSGGATVRYTADSLHRALERANWREGLPSAWQFLHIDAPVTSDAPSDDIPFEVVERVRYQALGRKDGVYAALDEEISHDPALTAETAGWRPDPNDASVKLILPGTGAGQMRAVGRVIGLTSRPQINSGLENALIKVKDSDANSELERLSQHLADAWGDTNDRQAVLRVVIITSWGGGAGSGLFTDVLETITALSKSDPGLTNNIAIISYAPEVSQMNPGTQGVAPNSFAAMCEYMNLFERVAGDTGGFDEKFLQKLLLIGASGPNQNLKMRSDREVYRYVGSSLAKIFTDQSQLEFISNYLFQNPQDEPYDPGFPFGEASAPRAAKSFGAASVSLGHDVFERYASERLANEIITTMLKGHLLEASDESLPADVVVKKLVAKDKKEFFKRTGLDEEGEGYNDVLEALRGTEADGQDCRNRWDAFLEQVRGTLASGSERRYRDEWMDETRRIFERGLSDVMRSEQAIVDQRRRAWVKDVQACFLNAVAEMGVSRYGLKYACELVEEMKRSVDVAKDEMSAEAAQREEEARANAAAADGVIQRLPERQEVAFLNTADWERWCDFRFGQINHLRGTYICRTAQQVLAHVGAGLLQPTIDTLNSLATQLANDASTPVVQQWAGDGDIPSHVIPPVNERLLVPTEEWRELFNSLVKDIFASYENSLSSGSSISRAAKEVVTGLFWDLGLNEEPQFLGGRPKDKCWPARPGSAKASEAERTATPIAKLFEVEEEWSPAVASLSNFGGDNQQGQAIRIKQFGGAQRVAFEIKEWAATWMRDREGAFSNHLHQSLSDWLSKDPVARSGQVSAELTTALSLSKPMVNINETTFTRVHGPPNAENVGGLKSVLRVGNIPLSNSEHKQARGAVEAALRDAGIPDANISGAFDPDTKRSEVEMISFTQGTFHPMVAESLMSPVREAWNTAPHAFGKNRRAKRFPEYLPLPLAVQGDMARGYLTALMLGHLAADWGGKTWADGAHGIWTDSGIKRFPDKLMGVDDPADVKGARSLLPALLASFPVALIDLSAGNRESIAAYARLVQLGSKRSVELSNWIRDGKLPESLTGDPVPVPNESMAGSATMPAEERKVLAQASLTKALERYQGVGAVNLQSLDVRRPGLEWEFRDVLQDATRSLLEQVATMADADSGESLLG